MEEWKAINSKNNSNDKINAVKSQVVPGVRCVSSDANDTGRSDGLLIPVIEILSNVNKCCFVFR